MPIVRTARSRLVSVTHPCNNSASGLQVKRCSECSQSTRDTKETIHNGLQLLRVRYGIPYSELPDCEPGSLGRFLSFLLLQGKERASVIFPRRQRFGKGVLCYLQRMCRRDRWEFAHSCSSIKRNLPRGCTRHTPSVRCTWENNALSQPPPQSSGYLQFVKAEVSKLFSYQWDKGYDQAVGQHLANPTSRACTGRADHLWSGRRSEFFTRTTTETEEVPCFVGRYKEVQSAGKKRPLLIYDERIDLLAPLHKLLYKELCKKDWLLCGPPSEGRIASVCVRDYQTSVDLVNATDGLSHSVSKAILDALFFTSVKIPRSIRSLAYASLNPLFKDEHGVHRRVKHGQMMGAYLSFPLLCLHSYLAALWASSFDSKARILVNGDDCIISASREVTMQDYPNGYRLNDDKTIRAKNVAEVNSTCFLYSKGRWRIVRHLKRGGATTDYVGMIHMAKAVTVSPAFVDAYQRSRIGRRWGFLPSQLGHKTYPSYLREKGMCNRYFTALPERSKEINTSLLKCSGTPSPVEAEALRSFFWKHGRDGGAKRDEWNPSCGFVRRTYGYRSSRYWSSHSYVGWRGPKSRFLRGKKLDTYFVPDNWVSEEEMKGLAELDHWREAFDSLARK
nr:MAG: RNA-dependent RNA polymerase [Dracophyllum associated botourmia-like virus 5]